MANRITRVPDGPVPPLARWANPAVPVADLFMLAMLSRPTSGSLRSTWVTPATVQMCVALVVASVVAGAVSLAAALSGSRVAIVLGVAVLTVAAGAAAVALVALAQRRAQVARPG